MRAVRDATPRTWAIVALIAQVAPAVLPIYPPGFRFPFLALGPIRFFIVWLLTVLSIAMVIGIGLVLLRRGSGPVAAGLFLGLGLLVSLQVLQQLVQAALFTTNVFRSWQGDVYLGLHAVSAAALLVSAVKLMRGGSEVPGDGGASLRQSQR